MTRRRTRVVPDVASPGRWVAQYRDPQMRLWFDIGDPRDTQEEACVAEIEDTLRAQLIQPLDHPQRMNSLGGSRGVHVQPEDVGYLLTPYHPSPERLMALYEDAQVALREAGWSVVGTLRPESEGPYAGSGVMPALWAWR
jgi:hypothetical protein